MDAADVVRLIIIAFEIVCAVILAGFMCRAIGVRPVRAMLTGVEILAFMAMSVLPAPRVPGRHDIIRRRPVTA